MAARRDIYLVGLRIYSTNERVEEFVERETDTVCMLGSVGLRAGLIVVLCTRGEW